MTNCLFLSMMLIGFCTSCYSQKESTVLKVLTYNIHYGVGMDAEKNLKRIAQVISELDPDLVGLQEVADSAMVASLAQMTNMLGVFGASTEKEPPNLFNLLGIPIPKEQLHYGDGILSKYPFRYIGNLSIPSASSSRYEAMCIEVDIDSEGSAQKKVRFITTHFDYLETIGSHAARKASIEVIEKAFVEDSLETAYILTGDLNATPNSDVLKLLGLRGWAQEDLGNKLYTVPSPSPSKQIDYVLVRPKSAWRIIDIVAVEEGQASDHLPIFMTLAPVSDR
ncbi:MAG: hypothetical protein HKN87_21135 [Saprospiraceae bacterium]|nr:hypothetical protein [Saprospiraceae bacterium]